MKKIILLAILVHGSAFASSDGTDHFVTLGSRQWSGDLGGTGREFGFTHTHKESKDTPKEYRRFNPLLDEHEHGIGVYLSTGGKVSKTSKLPFPQDSGFNVWGIRVSEGECLIIQPSMHVCLAVELDAMFMSQDKYAQPYFAIGGLGGFEWDLTDRFSTRLDLRHGTFSTKVNGVEASAVSNSATLGLGWKLF